jgi:hypothetical protein
MNRRGWLKACGAAAVALLVPVKKALAVIPRRLDGGMLWKCYMKSAVLNENWTIKLYTGTQPANADDPVTGEPIAIIRMRDE